MRAAGTGGRVGGGMVGVLAIGALPSLGAGGHEGAIPHSGKVSLVTLGCWL